jgi:hypothetical protein
MIACARRGITLTAAVTTATATVKWVTFCRTCATGQNSGVSNSAINSSVTHSAMRNAAINNTKLPRVSSNARTVYTSRSRIYRSAHRAFAPLLELKSARAGAPGSLTPDGLLFVTS